MSSLFVGSEGNGTVERDEDRSSDERLLRDDSTSRDDGAEVSVASSTVDSCIGEEDIRRGRPGIAPGKSISIVRNQIRDFRKLVPNNIPIYSKQAIALS